jgi:hypothetical protein
MNPNLYLLDEVLRSYPVRGITADISRERQAVFILSMAKPATAVRIL